MRYCVEAVYRAICFVDAENDALAEQAAENLIQDILAKAGINEVELEDIYEISECDEE